MPKRREKGPPKVHRTDVNAIGEEEAVKIFGRATTLFMKDVAKAAKKHGIEAHALWMYKYGTMRCCSTGIDETGRAIGLNVAQRMIDMSEDVLKTIADTMHTKGSA